MIEGSIFLSLLVIFGLLIVSAFFSGSETALTGVSRSRIRRLNSEGNKKAQKVSQLRNDKDRLIGTILLGNNAVNIAASAIATALAIHYFGDDGVLYVTIILTFVVLIFAEILPKTYAFRNTDRVALLVAPIFSLLVKLLSPITHALQLAVDALLKMLGVRDKNTEEYTGTETLRGAIELHHDAGVVVKDDRDMLDSILDLNDTEVSEIMVHRKQMETIDIRKKPEEIVKLVLSSSFTRIPFWEETPENIIGVLHVKDLILIMHSKNKKLIRADIYSALMDPWFIPEQTSLKDQLKAFMAKKNHFALVIDEYGDLQGLVTLEDILEEIVGQIEDEYDDKEKALPQITDEGNGSYLVEGTLTIRDINRELEWNLPDDEAATIAGIIIKETESIPNTGQIFQFHGYRFEIAEKKRNQITLVRIKVLEEKAS